MTSEELTQFTALAKKYEPKDRDAVLALVKSDMHPVFQAVHDEGHSAATQRAKAKETELTTAKAQAEEQALELKKQLDALGGKAPDLQAMQRNHEQQLEDLKVKQKAKLDEAKLALSAERAETAREKLVNKLVADHNIDPEYADAILTQKSDVKSRFKENQTGKVEVLQRGKDIPFTDTDGKTGLDLLAAELAEGVDQKWVTSKVNRGSGLRQGQSGHGASDGKKGSKFQQIRDEQAAKDKAAVDKTAPRPGLSRLGGRSAV